MIKRRLEKLLPAIPCGLLLVLATPIFYSPATGRALPSRAYGLMLVSAPAPALATPNPALTVKGPLKVWECTSSWYGEDFDGLPTASGEIYDMYDVTAAHPTLPLGSVVRVVNTKNHRSVVVRINDRGPYVEGRGLDVSYEAARRLGFAQGGLAHVRLELLEVPQRPALQIHSDD